MNTLTKKLSEILKYSLPKNYTSASYAIWKDGELLANDAVGVQDRKTKAPATVDCTYNVCSVSKVYCAVAVMQLVEKGLIDLDKPVCEYLPRMTMPDPRYKDITVRHCLSHTSGLPGTQWKGFSVSEVEGYDYYETVYDYLSKNVLKAAPGEYAVYCNDGFTLAEMVVAEVSGETFAEYCQHHITDPLGAFSTRLSPVRNTEYPLVNMTEGAAELFLFQGGGGFTTSMKDLVKFGIQFLQPTEMLSDASKAEMAKGHGVSFLKHDDRAVGYGLGWDYVNFKRGGYDLGEGVLLKSGQSFQFGTQFLVIPKYNAVICLSATHDCMIDVQETIIRLFAVAMLEQGINIYDGPVPVPQDMIDQLGGTWLIPTAALNFHFYGAHCSITCDDTRGGHKMHTPMLTWDGEKLADEMGRALAFETVDGETFASQWTTGKWLPYAQKAHDRAPLNDTWKARLGKKFIVMDAPANDMVINDMVTSFSIAALEGIEGVMTLSFSGRTGTGAPSLFEAPVAPLNDTMATAFLRTPGNPSRDAMTPIFEMRDGIEYCHVASFLYRDAATLPHYEGQTFETLGEDKVFRFGYPITKLPQIPEGRRLMILREDMTCVYDSLMIPAFQPVDKGYILFI